MLGSFLSAWIVFPLVLLLASLGCGLLVRALAGGELARVLVVPVGFALVVAICSFFTSYGALVPLAVPAVLIATLVGFALELREHGRLRLPRLWPGPWAWPALAALIAFAAVGAPVFLTGNVGWTGYTRIVDLAFQLDLAEHLASAGRVTPSGDSSYGIVTAKLLGIGYPGGSQATLGVIAKLIGANVAWCYQAFLAFAAAMGALGVYSILGRGTRSGLLRCIGGAVAIEPNVLYGYSLEAGIKELTAAALLMVLIATFAERLPGEGSPRGMIVPAVAASGAFGAFSLGLVPWFAVILVVLLAITLVRRPRRRPVLEGWAVFALVAAAISLPGLITALKLLSVAKSAIGGVVDLGLGNLAAPVSRWSSAGVYLTGDYRYPLVHTTATHVFDVVAIALAAVGVLSALSARRWALTAAALAGAVALYYYVEHTTAWLQFKAFTVTAVFTLLLAFAGAAALQASRRRWVSRAGWIGAIAIAAAVLYGNAIIYHDTSLAPAARYHDLAAIGARYDGQGPALDPFFDEYAEFFLRGEKATSIVNPAHFSFRPRPGIPLPPGGVSFGWDLNQIEPAYLQSFPLIIQPRSPTGSRAPSDYDLVQRTRYFEVWRRDRPASDVALHLPLSNLPHERSPALCREIVAAVRNAGPGGEIAYAQTSVLAVANPLLGRHPDYWRPLGPSTLAMRGAGTLALPVAVPAGGSYGIWLEGSIGRPLTIYLDGRRLGSVGYEERYPDQFVLLAKATLTAGAHVLKLVRGNGSLHAGSGDPSPESAGRTLGAIVFDRETSSSRRVFVAPATRAAAICARPVGYEWLEALKAGGAPPDALPAP